MPLWRHAARLLRQQQARTACRFSTAAAGEAHAQAGAGQARWGRRALLAAPPVGLAGWILLSDNPWQRCLVAYHVPVRLARDVTTAATCIADYRWSLRGLEGPAAEEARSACHLRCANRLQRLCFANGGIYIKLGQHVGQLDHLLPSEYVVTMRNSMLDKCPVDSLATVSRTLQEDLGAPPDQLFACFEERPIASASLAQVHVARDHQGRKLAVKVQHRGLRDTYQADTSTVEFLVNAVHWLYPDFNYQWLVDEVKHSLPKELDFEHEAGNAERCRANLASPRSRMRGRVVVPGINHQLSSKRVLTMEFIEGVGVTNRPALQALAIAPGEVAQLVASCFNEMIFTFGDVHCDPHAANMLVRRREGAAGPVELVLLDHGLYRQLDDDFRREYAALWQALIFGDAEGIKQHSVAMNAGDMYPLFAGVLTQRPWEQVTNSNDLRHLYVPNDKETRAMAQTYAAMYAKEISDLLFRMPPALLLLLKTNDCLRAVDSALGQSVNTFVIAARECSRALADLELRDHPGVRTRLRCAARGAQVEARMAALSLMAWLSQARARLAAWLPWGSGASLGWRRRSQQQQQAALQEQIHSNTSAAMF